MVPPKSLLHVCLLKKMNLREILAQRKPRVALKAPKVGCWWGWCKVGVRKGAWPCYSISLLWMKTFAFTSLNVFLWGLPFSTPNCFLHSPVSFLVWSFLWTATDLYLQHHFDHHLPLGCQDATQWKVHGSWRQTDLGSNNISDVLCSVTCGKLLDLSESRFTSPWNEINTEPPIPSLHNFPLSLELSSSSIHGS